MPSITTANWITAVSILIGVAGLVLTFLQAGSFTVASIVFLVMGVAQYIVTQLFKKDAIKNGFKFSK